MSTADTREDKDVPFVCRKFLIDTDAGLDDANAIFMALGDVTIDVVAITTVQGNTHGIQVARNVLRLLKVADRLDIPVYRGCDKSIVGVETNASHYHGIDGFGDVLDPHAPDENEVQHEHAVDALLKLSEQYRGELTLVCLGPLTNIAMAIRLQPDFGSRIKECFIMGGNYKGFGNQTVSGEFNFYNDPEAAYIVLNEICCPVKIVPWETCYEQTVKWDVVRAARATNSKWTNFMKQLEYNVHTKYYDEEGEGIIFCDEFLMACALDVAIIEDSSLEYATVSLDGRLTRGQMVVYWEFGERPKQIRNVTIIKRVNLKILCELFMKTFS